MAETLQWFCCLSFVAGVLRSWALFGIAHIIFEIECWIWTVSWISSLWGTLVRASLLNPRACKTAHFFMGWERELSKLWTLQLWVANSERGLVGVGEWSAVSRTCILLRCLHQFERPGDKLLLVIGVSSCMGHLLIVGFPKYTLTLWCSLWFVPLNLFLANREVLQLRFLCKGFNQRYLSFSSRNPR